MGRRPLRPYDVSKVKPDDMAAIRMIPNWRYFPFVRWYWPRTKRISS